MTYAKAGAAARTSRRKAEARLFFTAVMPP
jgi:hypothetical protein